MAGARTGSQMEGPSVASRGGSSGDRAGRRWDVVTAVAGLVFAALVLASFFTPDTPAVDDSAEEIAAGLAGDRAGHQWSLLLGFLADVAFLVFLTGVWSRLRRHEGAGGMLAGLFVVAGAAFAALVLVSEGLYLALVQAGATADPETLPALAVLNYWAGIAVVPPAVAMMLGAAAAILTTRALPVWLGWLAGLDALLLLLILAAVFETDEETVLVGIGGFGGFLLFLVWTLATSIVLLLRGRSGPHEQAAEARAAA